MRGDEDPAATDIDMRHASIISLGRGLHRRAFGLALVCFDVGFVAGLPSSTKMSSCSRQIEAPKYLRPRTDTPKLTIGHGGCFSCIYSVRGAGGYQMFGITPMPIYDPRQEISYLREFMALFKPATW